MGQRVGLGDELFGAEEVAAYLGVKPITVYRWCREGRLPCLKAGRGWRIRRAALDDFLERGERRASLVGRMGAFLRVPDHVIAIAETRELMHRMDAAYFQVAEARGGLMSKCYTEETTPVDDLRRELTRRGLDAARLEAEGRLRFTEEADPVRGRPELLRRLVAEGTAQGRSVWASFDWASGVSLEDALGRQEELGALVDDSPLVVETVVLEELTDEWEARHRRRAQLAHRGTIWISGSGLSMSRSAPLPDR